MEECERELERGTKDDLLRVKQNIIIVSRNFKQNSCGCVYLFDRKNYFGHEVEKIRIILHIYEYYIYLVSKIYTLT